ncbi:MAG: thiamine pyrophosphate-binding protein, partial [Nocardioidaceae bacterium]
MTDEAVTPETAEGREGHGGDHAVDVARAHRCDTMFTLSGAHVFPMYDAAVQADPPMRLVDVRHEPSAVFAAEASGKLTRHPGLAVLTAGPGVTNGVSAVAQAQFSGSPLVVVGGRAPSGRWGTGSLQELDHPPIFSTIAKSATTADVVDQIAPAVDNAFTLAGSSHRGPTFVDVPMDQLFSRTTVETPPVAAYAAIDPD